MEIEKLIDTVDDVNTLRKICKAINKEARKFQLDYNRAVAEMRAFKEQNEKLQKLLEPDSEEVSGLRGKNIVIAMGGK